MLFDCKQSNSVPYTVPQRKEDKNEINSFQTQQFKFQDDWLLKYLICKRCNQILNKPQRLYRCGHTFCDQCIIDKRCFSCKCIFIEKQADLMANNLINRQMVKCLRKDCTFVGSYQSFINDHKDNCNMKKYGGLQNWKAQIQKSLEDINRTTNLLAKKKQIKESSEAMLIEEEEKQQTNSLIIQQISNQQFFNLKKSLLQQRYTFQKLINKKENIIQQQVQFIAKNKRIGTANQRISKINVSRNTQTCTKKQNKIQIIEL